ncbi:hypothetical protein MMC17_000572 [Xylographa soralifera]|nr:hypothetical protein [Xylographa soralifera]
MAAGDALQLLAYTQNRKIQSSEYFTELAEHLLPKPVASIHSVPKPASIVCAPTTEKHPGLKYHDRACSAILECLINSQACTPNGSNNSTTDGACSSKCSSGTKADVPCIVQETSIADASTASRLPASQPSISTPSEPQPPKADSHISSPPQANTNILSFEELYTADNYVSSVLETPSPTPSEARSFRFPHTPIKITLPSARSLRPSTIPLSLLPQIAHNFRLLSSLLIHTYNLHHYPFPTYPSLLNRALTSPHHATISPAALTTILILRTSHLPAHNRKWYYLPSALMTLFFAVGLVLAIELSIYWNGISQTGDMGTVGQLVPFVLGVGGLVKVLWSWVCEGRGEGVEKDGLEEAVERCAEVYYEEKGRRAVGMGMVV